jgi:hypothetical protein
VGRGRRLAPTQQLATLLEQAIVPSLEMFAAWEIEGRARGGIHAGQRAGTFIIEAASAEEPGSMLASLPFWGMLKWSVVPLQSTRSTIERERGLLQARAAAPGR